ncbi:MAG: LysM peptidoglycan-binding domain-containing protein [Chloroflexota bacterium]
MKRLFGLFLILSLLAVPSAVLAQDDDTGGTHVVQSGENLFRIALRYGLTTDELAAANDITNTAQIYAGQTLVIPGLEAVDTSEDVANPLVAATPVIHVVQRGEYLGQIAALYGVTIDDILTANSITDPDNIFAGTELQIWTTDISVAPEATPVVEAVDDSTEVEVVAEASVDDTELVQDLVHTVAPGEYLSQIARQYGVPWTVIAEINNITDSNSINVGMQLVIPGTTSGAPIESVAAIAESLPDPGAHWGVGREIVVDLSTQMTYAYEDGVLVFSALVSTGLPATPTVQGEYSIWHRTPAQTMSGPGYNLPNVQWVQYFYQGYGFHGTYWHNNFGNPMSHGCVNMTNDDAQWLYNFGTIGTNVYVQY